ncbi:MAG: hypothetical protein ACRD0U_09625 [Acidimicrobiales bacterium]
MSAPARIEDRSDHDLLELINETDFCRMLHKPLAKDVVLAALTARAELIDRLVRWRWLTIEQARAAGAGWTEIDDAARLVHGGARAEYHATLTAQRRFGLVKADRADRGPAEDRNEQVGEDA